VRPARPRGPRRPTWSSSATRSGLWHGVPALRGRSSGCPGSWERTTDLKRSKHGIRSSASSSGERRASASVDPTRSSNRCCRRSSSRR
jgi:hypothetical protein